MSTGIGSSMYLNLPVQDVAAARTFTDPDGHQWEILWMSDQMPPG